MALMGGSVISNDDTERESLDQRFSAIRDQRAEVGKISVVM